MEQNKVYIESLLEKFFEGTTTNIEEQALYNFYSKEDIPESLMKYKPVFQYFENELQQEFLDSEAFSGRDNAIVGESTHLANKNTLLRKWIIGLSTVAASLLLLFVGKNFMEQETFNPYEGSYIKRGDVVILDQSQIEAEKARIEAMIEKKMACLDAPFSTAMEQVKESRSIENKVEEIQSKIEKINYY